MSKTITMHTLALFTASFFPFSLSAQNALPFGSAACGTDALHDLQLARRPEYGQEREQTEQRLYDDRKKSPNLAQHKSGQTHTLPLVFHIIHDNGSENISDDRIYAALDYLNDAFAHTGYFASAGPGVDVSFRFCLAQRAPGGAPTTGITRTQSALTNVLVNPLDDTLKNLIRWDPTQYVNIWVLRSILLEAQGMAYAGYATLPFSHGTDADGIVVLASVTGSSVESDNIVLAHEMGHYLGLYHTFQGGCPNDDCLLQGDRVCDTPPDQATFTACPFNSCHTDADAPAPNPFTGDVDDMTENFMDYSPWFCQYRFTEGQGERMRSLTELRRWSLLASEGCLEPCASGTEVLFSASDDEIPVGDTVFFANQSQNAQQYEWLVNGVFVSANQDFVFVPDAVGYYLVRLVARGNTPNCVSTTALWVHAVCNLEGFIQASANETVPGGMLQFNAAVYPADQFAWSVNGAPAGSASTLNWTFPNTGIYLVELTASNAFCTRTFDQTVSVNPYCAPGAPPQWTYRFGYPEIFSIETCPNGDVLIGGEDLDPMLMRVRPNGELAWAKTLDLDIFNNPVRKVAPTADNGALAVIPAENLLTRWDSSGNLLWSRRTDTLYNVTASNMLAAHPDGSGLLSGLKPFGTSMLVHFAPSGEVLWRRTLPVGSASVRATAACPDGGFLVSIFRSLENDFPIVRLNAEGEVLWARRYFFGASGTALVPVALLSEPDGGFSLVSQSSANAHFTILRCDAVGNVLWARRFTFSGGYLNPSFFKKTADGGYLCSGSDVDLSGGFGWDTQYFVRLDAAGNKRWAFLAEAFDGYNSVDYGPICADGTEAQGGGVFPMIHPTTDDAVYLMRTNANGSAGGCVEQAASVSSQSDSGASEAVSVSFQDAPVGEMPLDTLLPINRGYLRLPECPQFPLCGEHCDNGGVDDDRDGYPDCFDPQCACFPMPDCAADSLPPNFTARLAWESALANVNVAGIPLVANLDPEVDSIPEIIILEAPVPGASTSGAFLVFKGDGSNRDNPGRRTVPFGLYAYPATHLAAADLDQSGTPEVLAFRTASSNIIQVYTNYAEGASPALQNWGASLISSASASPWWRPQLADFNADGIPEIYSATRVESVDTAWHRLFTRVKGDTTKPHGRLAFNNFQYRSAQTAAAELLTRNLCNNDRDCDGLEIAAGPIIHSVDLDGWDGDPGLLTARRDLNVLDPSPAVWSDGYTAVADLNLDNILEVIVAGRRDAEYGVYVWNRNGLVRFFPYPENTPLSGGMPCVANVFDDRAIGFAQDFPEIIAASSNRLSCFNLNAAAANPMVPYWWSIATTDSTGFSAATAFDFNADGLDEVVYQDRTHLRLIYGDGTPFPVGVDANRNWFAFPAPTVTADQYPVVADCDGDGEAEIIFTSRDKDAPDSVSHLAGHLKVLEAAGLPWPAARPVWNQYGYFGPNVNDDLSIPVNQLEPQRIFGSTGKRPFNRFLGQPPVLNHQFQPFVRLANASLQVDSSWCGDEQLHLRLRVCNNGDRLLPDSLPLRFYVGNPSAVAATVWGDLQYVRGPIAPGACVLQNAAIPAESASLFFAMLNDDGSIPRPYNLSFGFTPVKSIECDYTDNLVSAYWIWDSPQLDLGPDLEACSANAVTLDAGAGFGRYRWPDGSAEQQYTAPGPGTYWADVWDECGFKQSDTLRIQLSPLNQMELGSEQIICPGDTISLTVNGFDQVVWSPASAVDCPNCPSVTLAPLETLLLVATGTAGDCFASDSARITVRPVPVLALGSTPAQGNASDGSAGVAATGGLPPYTFVWGTAPPQTADSIFNLAPGLYSVTATDAAGCTTIGQVVVGQTTAAQQLARETRPVLRPNPAGDYFFIEWELEERQAGLFWVVNTLGQVVLAQNFDGQKFATKIDCRAWPSGIYGVVLRANGRIWLGRVVVGH